MRPLTFAIDFDQTFTEDEEMWNDFIINGMLRGHTFYIVTMRSPNNPIPIQPTLIEEIIYTDHKAKQKVVEAMGIHIDIWCDDQPARIVRDYREE